MATTLNYRAPEITELYKYGTKKIPTNADVFSLGLVVLKAMGIQPQKLTEIQDKIGAVLEQKYQGDKNI